MMNNRRIEELMNYFDYQDEFTLDKLCELNVPSVYFPTKGSMAETLDDALRLNLIRYSKKSNSFIKEDE